jgi:hypothetical protein
VFSATEQQKKITTARHTTPNPRHIVKGKINRFSKEQNRFSGIDSATPPDGGFCSRLDAFAASNGASGKSKLFIALTELRSHVGPTIYLDTR